MLWLRPRIFENADIKIDPCFQDCGNSAEAGFYLKGYARTRDVFSLFIYSAAQKYLKLTDEMAWKLSGPSVTIKKLKEYDGSDRVQKIFLSRLFAVTEIVTEDDLKVYHQACVRKIVMELNNKKNRDRYYKSGGLRIKVILSYMILFIFVLTMVRPCFSFARTSDLLIPILYTSIFMDVIVGCASKILYWNEREIAFVGIVATCYFFYGASLFQNIGMLITHIIGIVCILFIFFFYRTIDIRTLFGKEMHLKCVGFRNYLKSLSAEEFVNIAKQDAERFYSYLSYTYAFGMNRDWYDKLDIVFEEVPELKYEYEIFGAKISLSLIKRVMGTIEASLKPEGRSYTKKQEKHEQLVEMKLNNLKR